MTGNAKGGFALTIPSLSMEGKKVIVTGARRGIGEATALAFAEAGADVAICDWVVEGGELAAVAEKIEKLGRRSVAVQADVSRKADVDNLIQRAMDEFGTIDVLVNNAGMSSGTPFLEMAEDEWDSVVDVHLKGCYLCTQAVARIMVEQKKGNIINIASVEGLRSVRRTANPYPAAKAGIMLLTRGLAWELGPYNIRVNVIAPGAIRTEMLRDAWSDPVALKVFEAMIPLGRMAEPSEIANVALFLASEASGFVTGHTLVVDAGLMAGSQSPPHPDDLLRLASQMQ